MMTVRCPNCEATYQLDASKLADGGRKLKCAKCHTVWLATAEVPAAEAAPVVETPAAEALVTEAPVADAPTAEAAPAEAPAAPVEDEMPPPEDLIERTPGVEAMVRVGGWRQWVRGDNLWRSGAMVLIGLGVLAGAGVAMTKWMSHGEAKPVQEEPVSAAPPRDTVENSVVQPPKGVVLHRVHGEVKPVEGDGGEVALTVRGLLTNTTSDSVVVPPLRLELLGDDGKVADMWPVSNVSGTLAPMGEEAWSVSLTAPDMSAVKGWRVVFVADKPAPDAE